SINLAVSRFHSSCQRSKSSSVTIAPGDSTLACSLSWLAYSHACESIRTRIMLRSIQCLTDLFDDPFLQYLNDTVRPVTHASGDLSGRFPVPEPHVEQDRKSVV